MSLTVVTYGGGDILYNVFNSLAMLLNANGGLIRPLMILGISCGTLFAVSKAFFSQNSEVIMLRFFLTLVAITGIFMIPTTTIHIEDILSGRTYKVDNTPWLIARTTELISSMGYNITEGIEAVMHVPNDTSYNETGMIFGSDIALDISKYKISNAVLEQNLKRISKQCVFYDLALNRYSLDELKKTTDLWKFLQEKTSKVRMIPYSDPTKQSKKTSYLTCQEAVREMTPIFEKEKNYYAHQDIIKDLPLTFQAMTGIKKNSEELVSQQLMMNVITGEFNANNFAKNRAHAQQKSTYLVLGSLASNSLITMRAVLEAIIYASIIFVLPLSVLPGGISFLSNWLWLTIWIQFWPPFYAIINYVMQSVSQSRASSIFIGLNEQEKGLSLFTSFGLSNLHEDIFALSGYLAASIPFISYAVIKGGMSSVIHLAGSMMTPAHAAATSAAGEQAGGNYNLASTSFGQTSYSNTTGFQHNVAPSLSAGFFSENQGGLGVIYANGEQILKQGNSDLRSGVVHDKSFTEGMQTAMQNSQTFTASKHKSYMESLSSHGRSMSDLTKYLSESQNISETVSGREGYDIQESARHVQSSVSSLASQHGLSERDSMSIILSAKSLAGAVRSVPILGSIVDGICSALPDNQRSGTIEDIATSALNIAHSDDFQKNFQRVTDFVKSNAHANLNDEGMRLVEGVTNSFDQVKSSQEQYQTAKTHSDQISETATWASQNAFAIKNALNQDLVNWTTGKLGAAEAQRVLTSGSPEEKSGLINEFVGELYQTHSQQVPPHSYQDPEYAYRSSSVQSLDKEREIEHLHQMTDDQVSTYGLKREFFEEKANSFETNMTRNDQLVDDKLKNAKFRVNLLHNSVKKDYVAKGNQNRIGHMWRGINADFNQGIKKAYDNLPLGWLKEWVE